MDFVLLLAALLVILLGAELFTNALEHLGERMGISEGVTGSVFAAVGTALPETMVPIVAILAGAASGNATLGADVGVGAILGAPLMLSTLALFLMAMFAAGRRGWKGPLQPEKSGLRRDSSWFLFCFGLAVGALFLPGQWGLARVAVAIVLVLCYFLYVLQTVRASAALVADGHDTEAGAPLYLRRLGLGERFVSIILQLVLGLVAIVLGAELFVRGVEHLSHWLGISALVLSMLIVPLATELPEKINSILWIRRGKDTLAFGNITGAMVFQGSLLPALGIALTDWRPSSQVLVSATVTLLAALYLAWLIRSGRALRSGQFLFFGLLYAAFVALTL